MASFNAWHSGAWRAAKQLYVWHSAARRSAKNAWVWHSGAWRKVFSAMTMTISPTNPTKAYAPVTGNFITFADSGTRDASITVTGGVAPIAISATKTSGAAGLTLGVASYTYGTSGEISCNSDGTIGAMGVNITATDAIGNVITIPVTATWT